MVAVLLNVLKILMITFNKKYFHFVAGFLLGLRLGPRFLSFLVAIVLLSNFQTLFLDSDIRCIVLTTK